MRFAPCRNPPLSPETVTVDLSVPDTAVRGKVPKSKPVTTKSMEPVGAVVPDPVTVTVRLTRAAGEVADMLAVIAVVLAFWLEAGVIVKEPPAGAAEV